MSGRAPRSRGPAFLLAFGLVAAGVGAARAVTTTFLPVLLDRIDHAPGLIGLVMLVNALTGFVVPLVVGVWSDRRTGGALGPRIPFIVGGSMLTCGGLAAIALGTASSYLALALAAGLVYVGLNATATAHRALVHEGFDEAGRPAATSAQELAMLLGAMAGIGAGGVLLATEPWLPFALGGVLVAALAVPTVVALARRDARSWTAASTDAVGDPRAARIGDIRLVLRTPGARAVLVAQMLWVAAYVALPAFFILYADRVLGLGPGHAALLPAGFGLLTGAGIVVAGRTQAERVHGRLVLGCVLLGGGLLGAAALGSLAAVLAPFAAAALGAGLVTGLGFPLFARFIPTGMSGRFSGAFFASRAIAAVVALPCAGFLIEVTGSYRFLLVQGGLALIAGAVLVRTRPGRVVAPRTAAPAAVPTRVAAVVPCYGIDGVEDVITALRPLVRDIVLVDDGAPPGAARRLDVIARQDRVHLVRLAANAGKGVAVATGARFLLDRGCGYDAIAVVDADGQHPPALLPDLLAALAEADVVIGDRSRDRANMPWVRRMTNSSSNALLSLVLRRRIRDAQCGMRAFRTSALERVPFVDGRFEAETRHLKASLRAGLRVAWVPIPAIYDGSSSAFRPVRDGARIIAAILSDRAPGGLRLHGPRSGFWSLWGTRLGCLVAGTMALGAAIPVLGPLDAELFRAIHALGEGPEWVYAALDPHTRNYILLAGTAVVGAVALRSAPLGGAVITLLLAAFFSDLLLQSVYLLYDRPRPEEVLIGEVALVDGRSWSHIASFPSGHVTVTMAIAAAGAALVPALRPLLWAYVGVIALTRITFGAHFPLDVAAGLPFGYVTGAFAVAVARQTGLLRQPPGTTPWRPVRRRLLGGAARSPEFEGRG